MCDAHFLEEQTEAQSVICAQTHAGKWRSPDWDPYILDPEPQLIERFLHYMVECVHIARLSA